MEAQQDAAICWTSAGLGMVRQGMAGRGKARLCPVRRGGAWPGPARRGMGFTTFDGGMVKQVAVQIRGTNPLLIHRFNEADEAQKSTRRIEISKVDPREVAKKNAYIAEDGTFYFSAFAIMGAMTNAGAAHKARGSRKTLRFVVPCAVRVATDTITILNGEGPADHFEVDSRPVTIPATKGRIMRHRPRFNEWGAEFVLHIDETLLAAETAQQLLQEAGQSIGIGDFRPEKRGPFGTFRVTQFAEFA